MSKKIISFILFAGLLLISIALIKRKFTKYPFKEKATAEGKSFRRIKHLAVIMDGNRRWAKEQGKPPWFGHSKGAEKVKMIVRFCVKEKIPYLTMYAFSTENFKRSKKELSHIFDIIAEGLTQKETQDLVDQGVRIKFIGDRSLFPKKILPIIKKIEKETTLGKNLIVNILFCYGGRKELTSSMKQIGKKIASGKIRPDDITEKIIEDHLWTAGCPSPDLVIRTGRQNRLSNFLPWQCVYSELLFSNKYWPGITEKDLYKMIENFEGRKRTFGK